MASSGSPSIPQGGGKPAGSGGHAASAPANKSATPVVKSTPAAPAAAAAAPANPAAKSKLLYGGIAGAALLVVVVGLVMWQPWKTVPPRLNDDPLKIAKFALTPTFTTLPFERQFTYMELLDDKEDAVETAYAEHKLTDEEYAKVQQAAYLGKHLKRARKYAKQTTVRAKEAYVDELIQKKKKKKSADKPKTGSTAAAVEEEADDIKRDDTEEQATINTWPAEEVAKWNAYRDALKARKDKLKEEEEIRKAAAASQTSSAKPDAGK